MYRDESLHVRLCVVLNFENSRLWRLFFREYVNQQSGTYLKKNSKMTDFTAKTDFCFGEVNSSKEAEPFRKLFSPRFKHWKMHVKIVTLYSIVTCLPSRPLVLVRAQKRKHRLLPLHLGNDKVNQWVEEQMCTCVEMSILHEGIYSTETHLKFSHCERYQPAITKVIFI